MSDPRCAWICIYSVRVFRGRPGEESNLRTIELLTARTNAIFNLDPSTAILHLLRSYPSHSSRASTPSTSSSSSRKSVAVGVRYAFASEHLRDHILCRLS